MHQMPMKQMPRRSLQHVHFSPNQLCRILFAKQSDSSSHISVSSLTPCGTLPLLRRAVTVVEVVVHVQ